MDAGTSVHANQSTQGTLTEGALAPLLGGLQRERACGWLRVSGMQLRGGIPSVVRLGLRLQDGRVVAVEASDDPLRPLPAGSDLAERATHALTRVLTCRDVVQKWEPASDAVVPDAAAPWLAALAVRAVERLSDAAVVESALGEADRLVAARGADEIAAATMTQAQRLLLTRVRAGVKASDLIGTAGEAGARDVLALFCAGAIDWAPAAVAPPVAETVQARGPQTSTSQAAVPSPPRPPVQAARSPTATATSQAALPRVAPKPAASRPAAPPPSAEAVRREVEAAHAALRGSTHFQVLGVGFGATPEEVRQAFSRLARRYHPDAQRDPAFHDLRQKLTELFVAVSDSYGVLKDAAARESYERSLGLQAARPASGTHPALRPPSLVGDPVESRLLAAEEALAIQQPWEAIRLLEEALPAATGTVRVSAHILLGRAYIARERPREAEKILLDVLQTDPRSVSACLLLGRLYRDRGMAKRARGMFERVLEVDPSNTEAGRELGGAPDPAPESPGRGSILSRLRGERS
jgi:hypothetical protein